jgi:phosphoribosyl-AMP cyclohydrolase / phosphoribosyl-ATP pyrophosphohydrolase
VFLKLITEIEAAALKFDEKGLIPAIVQDFAGGEVLMLAYMNEEALKKTLETGMTWFYSRSRQELWHKGLTSGNTQEVQSLYYDCDADTLLVRVKAAGPACHKGTNSCFRGLLALREGEREAEAENLGDFPFLLEEIIRERRIQKEKGSYVASLFAQGIDSMLKKIGEEWAEVVIAAKNDDPEELIYEAGDLLFHLILVLGAKGVSYRQVLAELARRHQKKRVLEE